MADETTNLGEVAFAKTGDAAAVIDVAKDAMYIQREEQPIADAAESVLLLRDDQQVRVEDLEQFLPAPRRAKGTAYLFTVQSFADYVHRHALEHATTVWVPPLIPVSGEPTIHAVINDHIDRAYAAATDGLVDGAQWGDWRAELALKVTEGWRHWINRDGQFMGQAEFAEHVEDGMRQIVSPSGAELFEIAQTLQSNQTVSVRSGVRLTDGRVQFEYIEDGEATAGHDGRLSIPETFQLAIQPFIGEQPIAITARLRYRTSGGNVRLGYKLDQPEEEARQALERIAIALRDVHNLPAVYIGTPRS